MLGSHLSKPYRFRLRVSQICLDFTEVKLKRINSCSALPEMPWFWFDVIQVGMLHVFKLVRNYSHPSNIIQAGFLLVRKH